MNDLYEGVELNAEQTIWICRGLPTSQPGWRARYEVSLIRQFFVTSVAAPSRPEQAQG